MTAAPDSLQYAGADDLLAALDPEQRAVATALRGPVWVVAGAGTGKTRAITHRIAYGVHTGTYVPTKVLAVTFTTRAAGEMRTRLRTLGVDGVQARTFHSAALRQLRYFWPRCYGGELPVLTQSKLGLVADAARQCRLDTDTALLRDLAGEIEWAKVSNVRPDAYPAAASLAGRSAAIDPGLVARVFGAYEELKRDRGRMDMEDVLLCTAALLADDADVAAQVRAQYRWFVVDEFQDVSPIQAALLDQWLGGRDDICVVGDPAQTIYSFAGASADYLTGFARRHPGARRIELVRNYRSTPQVIDAANRLVGSTGAHQGVWLRAQGAAGPPVDYVEHRDEVAEAEAVAELLRCEHDTGTPWGEQAVLFRINAQSEAFEEALASRQVPYVVRGSERYFDRPEVKQAVTLLRGAARAGQPPADGLLDAVTGVLTSTGWSAEPPTGGGAVRDRWESLHGLVGLAGEIADADPTADLTTLVAELDRRAAAQHAPASQGVTLATLHAAKGLEWDVVVLAGMHEGTMPTVHATTPAARDEERRLLYVGMTRARRRLVVTWSTARSPGARASRGASTFLDGLRPADTATDAGQARRQRTRRTRSVARCRVCSRPLHDAGERKLGRCAGCAVDLDEQLFDRLRGWRTQVAEQEQVPAYCVFTDATLTAIAEVRPADRSALLTLPGIGARKADKYGEDVLAMCASVTDA